MRFTFAFCPSRPWPRRRTWLRKRCACVPYAMARDGLFFRVADGIHPRFRTPSGAIVFQSVLACLMVLTGQFEDLFSLFIFAQWIFYALAVASVYGSRRKEPG